jgi:CubicO group peptidase (beta-lactamase class C family)
MVASTVPAVHELVVIRQKWKNTEQFGHGGIGMVKIGRKVAAFSLCLGVVILGFACRRESGEASDEAGGGLAGKIDEYMSRLTAGGFSGALLVAKDGEIVLEKGYGMADREKDIPVSKDTVFTVGSITKQFTAAAVLKLQMEGKLSVSDPITKYFEDVPEDKKPITLHHLLTHTAGFPGAIGDDFDPVGRDAFVKLAMETGLLQPPGERYEYSNVGFSLLGTIVELVSGEDYERFLHDHLFAPAGMTETGYLIPAWKEGRLAHGYRGDEDWGTLRDKVWLDDGPGWHLRANGGILSTLGDMDRWHKALEGDRILDSEAKTLYYTPHVPENEEGSSHYGYGWAIFRTPRNTRLIAHNGGNGIFAADFLRYLDEGVVIVAFSNTSGKPAWKASETVARIVFGEPYSLPLEKPVLMDWDHLRASPLGVHAAFLIEKLGGSTAEAEEFVRDHFKAGIPEARRQRIMRFVTQEEGMLGRVEFVEAVQTEEATVEALVRSREGGRRFRLTIGFEEAAPHRINAIGIDALPPGGEG